MVPFERAMVISYRPHIVTIALSLTIQPQFTVECFKSTWAGLDNLGQNLGRKELTSASQILTLSGKDMMLSCRKEILSISSTQCTNVKDKFTDW